MEWRKGVVRGHGYVETIFGRRIHIRDVKAQNAAHRAFGERQAINAPIQGSAADIIRRAMTRLPSALAENDLVCRLLLEKKNTTLYLHHKLADACTPTSTTPELHQLDAPTTLP